MKMHQRKFIWLAGFLFLIIFIGVLSLIEKNRVDHIKKNWIETTAEVIGFEGGERVVSTVIYSIDSQEYQASVQDGWHKIGDKIIIYVSPSNYNKAQSAMFRFHPFEFVFLVVGICGTIITSIVIVRKVFLQK